MVVVVPQTGKLANTHVPFCARSKFVQFWDLLKSETVKFDLKLQFIDYNAHSVQILLLHSLMMAS